MPRITKVYTRTGDDGTTALGGGHRVEKDDPRVAAYGTVDECSAHLGAALATGLVDEIAGSVRDLQNDLFHLGADLCFREEDKSDSHGPGIEERHVLALEALMDRLSETLEPLENFVLPGGSPGAAHLHVARAVCRRAERDVVALSRREAIGPWVVRYLNRLSDTLFVMARYENHRLGHDDVLWDSRR